MASRWSKSRLLICVLALHLAHAPVPWCDGDSVVSIGLEPGNAAGPSRGLAVPGGPGSLSSVGFEWDVDVVLLGVQPPRDTDQGPFDVDPERICFECLGAPYLVPPLACELLPRLDLGASADGPSARILPSHSPTSVASSDRAFTCFGATFEPPGAWRTLLAVLLC